MGRFWPSGHHQEGIENEKRYCNVVKSQCLCGVGPDLVGSPEQKGRHKHDGFDPIRQLGTECVLIEKVRNSNPCQ